MAFEIDNVQREVLEIILRAQDNASGTLSEFGRHLEGTRATMASVGAGLMGVGTGFAVATVGLGLGMGAMVKQASDYQTMLVHIQANAGLTDAATTQMSLSIQKMASQTGAPLDQLAQGFMHTANFGFTMAESMKIVDPALKSALSTGADVGDTMSALAGILHEFSLPAADAAKAMNALHLGAQMGNATLQQFEGQTTKALNTASNYHVSLTDIVAAMSTLTQSNQTARQASNGMVSVMQGIIKPTATAAQAIGTLQRATGVDLRDAFSVTGLRAHGLAGALGMVRGAVEQVAGSHSTQQRLLAEYSMTLRSHHISVLAYNKDMTDMARALSSPEQMLTKLFANQLAAREVMLLTGNQAQSFAKHLTAIGDAMSGKTDPTTAAFIKQQATLGAQTSRLNRTLEVLGISIGTALIPSVQHLLTAITPIVQRFALWAEAHSKLVARGLELAVALGAIAAVAFTVGGAMLVIGAAMNPIGLAIMGLIGASGALAAAWATNWQGMRGRVDAAWGAIQPILQRIGATFADASALFQMGGIGPVWEYLRPQLVGLVQSMGTWLRTTGAPALVTHLQSWADALWGWVKAAWPPLLREAGALAGRLGGWIVTTGAPALVTRLQTWGAAFWGWVQPVWAGLMRQLGPLATRLGNWITATGLPLLGAKLAEWGGAFWEWLRKVAPPKTREVTRVMLLLAAALAAEAVKLGVGMMEGFTGWFQKSGNDELVAFGQDMGNAIFQGIMDAMGQIGPHLGKAGEDIAQSWVKKTIPVGWDWLKPIGFDQIAGGAGALFHTLASPSTAAGARSLIPGTTPPSPGPHTTHITVHVHKDAVQVQGTGDTLDPSGVALGKKMGDAVAEALRLLVVSQKSAAPGAHPALAGAR